MRNKSMKIEDAIKALHLGLKLEHTSFDEGEYAYYIKESNIVYSSSNRIVRIELCDEYREGWSLYHKPVRKIVDLMNELRRIYDLHGNISVHVQGGEYGEEQNSITDTNVESVHFSNPEEITFMIRN